MKIYMSLFQIKTIFYVEKHKTRLLQFNKKNKNKKLKKNNKYNKINKKNKFFKNIYIIKIIYFFTI